MEGKIQNRYSMLATWYDKLFPVCEELHVGYVAFSPLGNGFLTGKHTSSDKFTEGDFRNFMPQYTEEGFAAAKELLDLMSDMSKAKGVTMAQLSLAWMLSKKPYIVPIPGSRKEERLKENAGAADVVMTPEEVGKIDKLLATLDIPVFGGHNYTIAKDTELYKLYNTNIHEKIAEGLMDNLYDSQETSGQSDDDFNENDDIRETVIDDGSFGK